MKYLRPLDRWARPPRQVIERFGSRGPCSAGSHGDVAGAWSVVGIFHARGVVRGRYFLER